MMKTSREDKQSTHPVWRFVMWLLVAVGVLGVLLLFTQQWFDVSTLLLSLQNTIYTYKQGFFLFRMVILGLLVWTWPLLIRRLVNNVAQSEAFLRHWPRIRLTVWLAIIEVLFVQGWLARVIHGVF